MSGRWAKRCSSTGADTASGNHSQRRALSSLDHQEGGKYGRQDKAETNPIAVRINDLPNQQTGYLASQRHEGNPIDEDDICAGRKAKIRHEEQRQVPGGPLERKVTDQVG